MNKKYTITISIMAAVIVMLIAIIITMAIYTNSLMQYIQDNNLANGAEQTEGDNSSTLNLPTSGNDYVLNTDSNTTIRVVNEYDKNFLTKDKNLLIMFASWCPNCQEEITEIQKILERYEDSKDINVVVIAHEYNDTVTDLIDLLENDVDFGNIEVKLDLVRVIRKTIDPEASTIPISYVVDKNGKVLEVLNEGITLNKAIDMLED